ncbi:MAG TPA: hypothetical protein PLP30_11795 [Clostridia bacterium]|nr:hypothetical protein [Clostridia bacterium]
MSNNPRILFVGNSITWHPVKEEIGWLNEWGMAASSDDNDYVHITMRKIYERFPGAEYKIAWAVAWEREYWDAVHLVAFREFLNFKADIIVVKINENVSASNNERHPYKQHYEKLLDYLNPEGVSRMILCTGFWRMGIIDEVVRSVAMERQLPLVELNHLDRDEMKAIGLFEHKGVANHPGDRGMQEIAELVAMKVIGLLK